MLDRKAFPIRSVRFIPIVYCYYYFCIFPSYFLLYSAFLLLLCSSCLEHLIVLGFLHPFFKEPRAVTSPFVILVFAASFRHFVSG
jgi:hypothetical protein